MMPSGLYAKTLLALGWRNVAATAAYRLALKFGLHPVQRLKAELRDTPFFASSSGPVDRLAAMRGAEGGLRPFGWAAPLDRATPPDWHANVLTGKKASAESAPWWTIPDFDPALGDVKAVWEPSRLGWLFAFCADIGSGDRDALCRINDWLSDWCRSNPPYLGRNWKCAQEASLRVLHLAMTALLLEQIAPPSPAIRAFLAAHIERILPTLSYARAQDNNHGTSEAAALLVGAGWLSLASADHRHVAVERRGRAHLKERLLRLVADDGSFAQHSTTYHRMLLDTLCIAELWRRATGGKPFDDAIYDRARRATRWLLAFVDPRSGRVPNLGHADGTRLLPVTNSDFLDFRPAAALASALFLDEQCVFEAGGVLDILPVSPAGRASPQRSQLFDDGGYAILKSVDGAMAVLRYPRFRFRPSQCDALHLDLMLPGRNVLRDGGTFSYAADTAQTDPISGTRGHNTVCFDGREQMPKLSRFLLGRWLKTRSLTPITIEGETQRFAAAYRDDFGATHCRRIALAPGRLRVEDDVSGFTTEATLRWRLMPSEWRAANGAFATADVAIRVTSSVPCETRLVDGVESLHYLDRETAPVIETRVAQAATLVTEISWSA